MNASKFVITAVIALALAGCGGGATIPDPEPTDTVYGSDDGSNSDTYGSGGETLGDGTEVPYDPSDPSRGELEMVIYFDFDSSEVPPDATDTVSRHAMQLMDDAGISVRLDGHTDEQGSREYNIGLGERRAQAVRRLLLLQGASADQIKTVSFGEERPDAFGSDDASYARNRRVVINYEN